MKSKTQLAEVFGFAIEDTTPEAMRARQLRLCPFNNIVAVCTKDSKEAPLGVCSMYHRDQVSALCPIRFRERWAIAQDAAEFFFQRNVPWKLLPEVRLQDKHGKSVGKVDFVVAAHDEEGNVLDYGGLEVQSVYVSGTISEPFRRFMDDPIAYKELDWTTLANPPRPDFLSSLKRVIPQLYTKSRILRKWGRKMAITVDEPFFASLPLIEEVSPATADLLWLVYGFERQGTGLTLTLKRRAYCDIRNALSSMMDPEVGEETQFIRTLEKKVRGRR